MCQTSVMDNAGSNLACNISCYVCYCYVVYYINYIKSEDINVNYEYTEVKCKSEFKDKNINM